MALAVLKPWLARADAVLPADWRARVCDARAIVVTPEQWRLARETLELVTLALRVAPTAVRALLRDDDRFARPLESLRVQIVVDAATNGKLVVDDWKETTASDEYQRSKAKLAGGRRWGDHTKLDVHLEMRLTRTENSKDRVQVGLWAEWLSKMDRRAVDMAEITVRVATGFVESSSLAALMREVEKYAETTKVTIALDLSQPQDERVRLIDWKKVLDITTRWQSESVARTKEWSIELAMGGEEVPSSVQIQPANDDTYTRVIVACMSAVAHADDHVTSVTIANPLEHQCEKDCYKPTERRLRAKWLGYLLRVGRLERMTISERTLTHEDIDMIASTLLARNLQVCLGALRHEAWHEQKIMSFNSNSRTVDTDLKAAYPTYEPSDIVGVMQDFDEKDHLVDVLLVGYGQCTVPRSSIVSLDQYDSGESVSRLKSLKVCLQEGQGTEGHLLRVIMLLGKDLEELIIDTERSQIALSVLIIMLASCPQLKRLSVKSIYLAPGDDEQMYLPTHWANHPLEELSVDLNLNEASIGLAGLATMLVTFGVQLKKLSIQAEPPMNLNTQAKSAMENMLRACCRSLDTLQVVGLSIEYFQGLFVSDTLCLSTIKTLILTDTVSDASVWRSLMSTLAVPKHPLTQSLHTLRIYVDAVREIPQMIAAMLQANDKLVRCELVCPSQIQPPKSLMATQGRSLRRRKEPLSLHQKAAFLSIVERSVLPWESSVLSEIFAFAAPTERRHVGFATV